MESLPKDTPLTDFNIAAGTHEGMVGKNNEDALDYFIFDVGGGGGDKKFYVAVVADGVGGQSAGEFASKLTIETVRDYFSGVFIVEPADVPQHLQRAATAANMVVYERAQNDEDLAGMATTIVLVGILDGLLFTAHVGDSRIYLMRDGKIHQLTKDHSWVQEAVDAGLITAEQARRHPNRNVIRRSMGTQESVQVDQAVQTPSQASDFLQGMPLKPQDVVVLCSDGLSDMISDYEIYVTLAENGADIDAAVESLIDKANDAGGRDNISVIALQTTDSFEPHPNPPRITVTDAERPFVPPLEDDEEMPDDIQPTPQPPPTNEAPDEIERLLKNEEGPHVVPVSPAETERKRRQARRKRTILWASVFLIVLLIVLVAFGGGFFS